MMDTLETLKEVGERFRLPGKLASVEQLTNGNINSTYKVTYRDGEALKNYIFQKINTLVFKNPKEVMGNIDLVTTHIRTRFPNEVTLHFHHTEEGLNYLTVGDNGFYRVMGFVDAKTFNATDSLKIVNSTGKGFGRFQMQLADLPGEKLFETIPDFHHTAKRMEALWEAVAKDTAGKASEVQDELQYLKSVAEKASELSIRFEKGEFPVRVTHNDTKCNNILFDKNTDEPLVVIDLDTVMPGMAMYDFGDGIRFIANTANEDEPDLSKVSISLPKYKAFTEGFLSEVRDALTKAEIEALPLGAFSATVELAARFLTDYLNGNVYFKTLYPEHNLARARNQIALAKSMEAHFPEMQETVREMMES